MRGRTLIALTVTTVWASGYIAQIASGGAFSAPIEVNAVMLLVAGFFFGFRKDK